MGCRTGLISKRHAHPRYAAFSARGLQIAAETDTKNLVIVDEVQIGTRHSKFGKRIRGALAILFEQAAALNDVFIVATQRDVNAAPSQFVIIQTCA